MNECDLSRANERLNEWPEYRMFHLNYLLTTSLGLKSRQKLNEAINDRLYKYTPHGIQDDSLMAENIPDENLK